MKRFIFLIIVLSFFLIPPFFGEAGAATSNDYCITPPFVVGGVKPNLLLMLDNSASQYDLEFIDKSATSTFCYDNTYNNSNTCSTTTTTNCTTDAGCPSGEKCINQYSGYFDPTKCYTSPGVTYTTDTNPLNTTFSQFTETSCSFAGCTHKATQTTDYLCIVDGTVGDPPVGPVTFSASGKFLNWLSASKMDVAKQILTGGKYDVTNSVLVGESRGCVGSRFVKEVPDADWTTRPANSFITFGVRGDVSADLRLPSTGGTTRIDIFKSSSNFNNAACQDAIACELAGGTGCQSKVANCIDPGNNVANQARATFNHALTRCWQCPSTGCCPENFSVSGDGNIVTGNYGQNNNECNSLTDRQRSGQDPIRFAADGAPIFIGPTDPMYICLKDTAVANPSFPGCTMNNYAQDVLAQPQDSGMTGQYIGTCYNPTGNSDKGKWSSKCVQYQFANFCRGLKVGEVVDPSSGPAATTSQTGNIPAILLDSGIMGQSVGAKPIRTYHGRVSQISSPGGLIQQFQNQIRFGAMSFNTYGSKAPLECGNPSSRIIFTCNEPTNKDGGKVISYIGAGKCSVTTGTSCIANSDCPAGEQCNAQVGDHATAGSLISQIDAIRATTWTPFSEGLYNAIGYFAQRTDLRINSVAGSEDFLVDASHNPVQFRCQKNNVLLITDGMSTADLNPSVYGLASGLSCGGSCNITGQVDTALNPNIDFAGSRNLADMAAIAQTRDITDFSLTPPTSHASHKITTYVVFSGTGNAAPGEANPLTLMQDTASYGGGSFQLASNPYQLQASLSATFQTIATGASSGTAASVLASGEGSGANLIQALFYPSRTFTTTEIKWIGALQNFWYYVDPRLGNSSIREETNNTAPPYVLDLKDDYILHFRFDGTNTLADLYSDPAGTGVAGTLQATKCLDETLSGHVPLSTCSANPISYLWEAGKKLYQRTDARKIYTTKTGAYNSQIELFPDPYTVTDATLTSLLQASNDAEATAIVRYVKGADVKVCDNLTHTGSKSVCTTSCSDPLETCGRYPYRNRTVVFEGLSSGTWKLGDIINSTPKVVSQVPLNFYHKIYGDTTYQKFIDSTSYQNRGMVFVGANDGMLHAFNLGSLSIVNDATTIKAKLDVPTGGTADDIGKEAWAFIPKNALPYLKYMAEPDYGHLYYVDATPYIFDASIGGAADALKPDDGSSWKTILIGSMRTGGASGKGVCSNNAATACVLDTDCGAGTCNIPDHGVKTPIKDPVDATKGVGYSSYFALDITNPTTPVLLWEFSDADLPAADKGLGFATSGPAVVRINGMTSSTPAVPDPKRNGNWFVVFASGPTGAIDTTAHQFKGESNQNLRIYILDLRTGQLLNPGRTDTGITNAFAGSLINAAVDFDQNDPFKKGYYSDDALYFGYAQADNANLNVARWTKGGVLRLVTGQSPDPTTWVLSPVMDSTVDSTIGPVTSAVTKLQNYDTNKVFLFFGSGRYFYKIADQVDDDGSSGVRRKLYGVLEPCVTASGDALIAPTCTTKAGDLGNVTNTHCDVCSPDCGVQIGCHSGGWFINLDLCTDSSGVEVSCAASTVSFKSERMVTDPLATPIGVVFFTTTKPTADVCEFGGRTHFWAVQYDTGGAVKKGVLRGKALIQVSTGSIEERDLSTSFRQRQDTGAAAGATVDYRRTDMIPGVPPSGSPPGILIPPKPVNKIIHMKER